MQCKTEPQEPDKKNLSTAIDPTETKPLSRFLITLLFAETMVLFR